MKIRNISCAIVSWTLVVMMMGCGEVGDTSGRTINKQNSVNDVLQAGISESDAPEMYAVVDNPDVDITLKNDSQSVALDPGDVPDNSVNIALDPGDDVEPDLSSTEGIDVDLTLMSSTMVYSEIYNMVYEAGKYIGKTVKMNGTCTVYVDETNGKSYYTCIVEDATACCARGIEFELSEDYLFPDEYPEAGENITVLGTYDTYMEGEYVYCTLREASYF